MRNKDRGEPHLMFIVQKVDAARARQFVMGWLGFIRVTDEDVLQLYRRLKRKCSNGQYE